MQTVRIKTTQNIDIDYEIAGLGERVLGRLIDIALFILIMVAGAIIISLTHGLNSTTAIIVLVIVYLVLFVFYDLGCETMMDGQSVGKKMMKIKVISLDGGRPSIGQYLLRWLFRIVDFSLSSELCALICVAVSDKKQRLGDMVAGTTLIKTKPRVVADGLVFTPVVDTYQPVFTQVTLLNDDDISLIHEVIRSYFATGNQEVVFNAARRLMEILSVTIPAGMDALQFLQTIVKDYTYLSAANGQPINN